MPKQKKIKTPVNEKATVPDVSEGQPKMVHEGKPKIERQVSLSVEGAPPEQGKVRGPVQRTVAPAGNGPQDGGQGKAAAGKQKVPKKPKKAGEPSPSVPPGQ